MIKETRITQSTLLLKLWSAAETGDAATIRQLGMQGIPLDARNAQGLTALDIAQRNAQFNAAKTIMAAREYQFLKNAGTPFTDIGNFNPLAPRHMNL